MFRKFGSIFMIMVLVIAISGVAVAVGNGRGNSEYGETISEEASENGLDNRATPAVPGTDGTPATPAVPSHKEVNELNLLSNSFFREVLSFNTPDENGVVDTENSWIFFTNSGAEGNFELDKKVAKIIPLNVDAPSYGIQLIQSPIVVEKLGIYSVSITAKSEEPRNITIKVGASGLNGWVAYSEKTISLTPEMTTYNYEFSMHSDTDAQTRFEIFFAEDLSPVWIEDVCLEKIGEEEPGITLEDLLNRTKTEADEDLVETWELVWEDNFDSINLENWTYELGNGHEKGIQGWGNNELEYYTDSPKNTFIEDGSLVIQANKEETVFTFDGIEYTTDYTSARMVSEDKVTTKYGKIEAKIQVPSGQGIWSAFWMLGADIGEVGWPECGEIDILEYIGSNVSEIHGTVHGPITSGPGINGNLDEGIDLSLDYHVYSIEWDEDEVEFYIDDILYHIVNKDEVAYEFGPEEWVYDHEHYMILNLAVGGNWPGSPDDSTIFPKQLKVDYIRIYKDINPDSINGEEVIDSIYELPPVTPSILDFSNGNFENDLSDWEVYMHFDAEGTISVINQEAVLNLVNDGNEEWSVQLYQGPYVFEGNKSYTLEFDARSDLAKKISVVIDDVNYNRYLNEIVTIGNEMSTFSFIFTMDSDTEGTLKFLAGELGDEIVNPQMIYIDNVYFSETDNTQ